MRSKFDATKYYYILDDQHQAVPVDNMMTWGRWFEHADRTLRSTYLDATGTVVAEQIGYAPARRDMPTSYAAHVSTVFLGLNHNHFDDGPPILWETLVFVQEPDDYASIGASMQRYSSVKAALNGHAHTVQAAHRALAHSLTLADVEWPEIEGDTE